MNSTNTKTIIDTLSNKYNISQRDIKHMILRYFEAAYIVMKDKEYGYPKIRIVNIGKFIIPYYRKLLLELNTLSKKNKNKIMESSLTKHEITIQGGPDRTFENNTPFYFVVKDDIKLSVGDKVYFQILHHGSKTPELVYYLEGEILDFKHPFYSAAVSIKEDMNEKTDDSIIFKKSKVKYLYA